IELLQIRSRVDDQGIVRLLRERIRRGEMFAIELELSLRERLALWFQGIFSGPDPRECGSEKVRGALLRIGGGNQIRLEFLIGFAKVVAGSWGQPFELVTQRQLGRMQQELVEVREVDL